MSFSNSQSKNFGAAYNSLQMKFQLPDGRLAVRRWSDASRSEYLINPESGLPLFNDEGKAIDEEWLQRIVTHCDIVVDYEEFQYYQILKAENRLNADYADQIKSELLAWEMVLYNESYASSDEDSQNPKVEEYRAKIEKQYLEQEQVSAPVVKQPLKTIIIRSLKRGLVQGLIEWLEQ
jgi:hypothetical protein